MTNRTAYRVSVAVLVLSVAMILASLPFLDHSARAAGRPGSPGNPVIHVHPLVISQFCDEAVNATHPEHCLQASGGNGNPVTAFPPNGQPNQQFNVFLPSTPSCGDNITDTNCPFPGVTPGEQIVVIGGQAPQNAGSCAAYTALRTQGVLAPCNGGTGTVFVVDGHAIESGLLGRQTGGKTYLCENPVNVPTVRTTFTAGDCQWSNLAQ